MKVAICPGSYDPVTYGHLDIIRRSAGLVDKLIVTVFVNPTKKKAMFTIEERLNMLRETTKDIPTWKWIPLRVYLMPMQQVRIVIY